MKQKLQELRAKLQTNKGSILVYTLIIMMIMLSTALSIFAVAVREKKGAGTTAASTQAFAVADSGSEIALKAANDGTIVQDLGACSNGTVTINIVGGEAKIIFYKDEDSTEVIRCNESASLAQKVKSVGRYAGTARAVEVAVAQTGGSWVFMNDKCGGDGCVAEVTCPAGMVIAGYRGGSNGSGSSNYNLGDMDNTTRFSGTIICSSVTLLSSNSYRCTEKAGDANSVAVAVAVICSK